MPLEKLEKEIRKAREFFGEEKLYRGAKLTDLGKKTAQTIYSWLKPEEAKELNVRQPIEHGNMDGLTVKHLLTAGLFYPAHALYPYHSTKPAVSQMLSEDLKGHGIASETQKQLIGEFCNFREAIDGWAENHAQYLSDKSDSARSERDKHVQLIRRAHPIFGLLGAAAAFNELEKNTAYRMPIAEQLKTAHAAVYFYAPFLRQYKLEEAAEGLEDRAFRLAAREDYAKAEEDMQRLLPALKERKEQLEEIVAAKLLAAGFGRPEEKKYRLEARIKKLPSVFRKLREKYPGSKNITDLNDLVAVRVILADEGKTNEKNRRKRKGAKLADEGKTNEEKLAESARTCKRIAEYLRSSLQQGPFGKIRNARIQETKEADNYIENPKEGEDPKDPNRYRAIHLETTVLTSGFEAITRPRKLNMEIQVVSEQMHKINSTAAHHLIYKSSGILQSVADTSLAAELRLATKKPPSYIKGIKIVNHDGDPEKPERIDLQAGARVRDLMYLRYPAHFGRYHLLAKDERGRQLSDLMPLEKVKGTLRIAFKGRKKEEDGNPTNPATLEAIGEKQLKIWLGQPGLQETKNRMKEIMKETKGR